MFRPWRSFPTMVAAGLVVGIATGGFPAYSQEVSQGALVVALSFALTEISFRGMRPQKQLRDIAISFAMSYGILTGLLILFAAASSDQSIRNGWIVMAAVPPAVAVVPITSYLRGDTRRALISLAVLYVLGLGLVPAITLAFTNEAEPVIELVLQTILLLGVPMVVSRPLRRWSGVDRARATVVSLSFFVLVVAIAGSTRGPLLERLDLLAPLAGFALARTFGLGGAVWSVTRGLRLSREDRLALTTFVSFKNLGLTVVLSFRVFGALATLPSIVSLVFEILWLAAFPIVLRTGESTPAAVA